MKYKERSLLEFCRHLNIDLSNVQHDLSAIKKQIQLEFKAAKNGVISIGGSDYDFNFINDEFSNPNLKNILKYEQWIQNIDWLNDFINYAKFDFRYKLFTHNTNYDNLYRVLPVEKDTEEFRQYISPKMAKSFNTISKQLLDDNQFIKQKIIMNHLIFIKTEDHHTAFSFISVFLNDVLKFLKNTNVNNYKQKNINLDRWSKPCVGAFLNALPNQFDGFKKNYTVQMVGLVSEIFKIDLYFAYALSKELIKIDSVPHNIRKVMNKNHKVIEMMVAKGYKHPSDGSIMTVFYTILLALVLLGLLTSFFKC